MAMASPSLYMYALMSMFVSSTYASGCAQHKLDVIAVLDGSGSINGDDFVKQKNAVIQLAQDLNLEQNDQRFGALVFSNSVTETVALSTNFQSLRSAISRFSQPASGTATDLGIQSMTQMFQTKARSGAKKVGIVITDGQSRSASDTIAAANAAKGNGITMFAIGVGPGSNKGELSAIASTSSSVVYLDNFSQLKSKFKSLIEKICPKDGGWSSWSRYSSGSCSRTCGGGTRTVTETRTCTNPRPENGGKPCAGSARKTSIESCNTNCCPRAGGWSSWKTQSRTSCSKTCGGGVITVQQSRSCTNPTPACGGATCMGSTKKVFNVTCNTFNCPIHGGWTKWTTTSRSECSVTCGGGVITVQQTRSCTNPAPLYGGNNCGGSEDNVYTVPCNTFACPSCDGCLFENGVGFLPHPTDCRFFVQCFERGSSYVIKQCPAGLYWNQEHLTCTSPSATNCTTTATIAPPVDLMSTVPPPPPPPPGPCEKTAVPGKPSSYSENVDSYGVLESQCAPGTVFDITACGCVHGGTALPPGCTDELYLPLSKDLKDHSSHKLYVESNGVKITNSGMASFANNAVIRIHRFSNMDFGKTLDISFLLHKTQNTSKDEAVVTNAECIRTGNIYIILKTSVIEFRVGNQKGAISTVTVPLTKTTGTVRLNVHKGVMTGEVNGIRKKTSFKGRIGKVLCALQIGRGHGLASFTGMLKDFKLSLCRP